jgi:hypothetical protein
MYKKTTRVAGEAVLRSSDSIDHVLRKNPVISGNSALVRPQFGGSCTPNVSLCPHSCRPSFAGSTIRSTQEVL